MQIKWKALKTFNWNLFFSLCLLALLPAIYQTIKTYIISTNNATCVFDIIGQMEWFDLCNETLQAFLIVPLYAILNKIFSNDKINFAKYTFKTGLIAFVIYTLFSIAILVYGVVLIKAMNPNEIDIITVKHYLQLETIAFMLHILVSFVNVVFVVVGKSKNVYIFLSIQIVLAICADFIFIPKFSVYGIAISNIVVNGVLAITSVMLLFIEKLMHFCWYKKQDIIVLKAWGKIGFFSGVQQFIDNFIYAVMVVKMVNMVVEQGNYWVANNFIWGWLLIPITALAEVIRHDCKNGYTKLQKSNYCIVVAAIICVWILSIPLWLPFFKDIEKLENATEIFYITIQLALFYIAYCCYTIIDNIFIGLGKTIYTSINSLLVNIGYYGIFYICYKIGIVSMNLKTILYMFGFGMIVHLVISLIEAKFFFPWLEERRKKNNYGL